VNSALLKVRVSLAQRMKTSRSQVDALRSELREEAGTEENQSASLRPIYRAENIPLCGIPLFYNPVDPRCTVSSSAYCTVTVTVLVTMVVAEVPVTVTV
jgi:hypothetical protein